MDAQTETGLIAARTSGWFAEFVTRTDEKQVTADAIARFVMNLRRTTLVPRLFYQKGPSIVDIGTGTGHLSAQIKDIFESMTAEGEVDYNGIEHDPKFAALTQRRIKGSGVIMSGDGFADAQTLMRTLQLDEKPDVIVGSHLFIYSPDLAQSITNIRDLMKPSSIAMFINPSPKSDAMAIPRNFARNTGGDVIKAISKHLSSMGMAEESITFRAHLHFPEISEGLWQELHAAEPYDDTHNPHAKHENGLAVRKLMEFIVQRPLEALSQQDRDQYLDGIMKKLRTQNNTLYMDNILQVAISPNPDRTTKRAVGLAASDTRRELAQQIGV